jgi:hypothetical protein
MAVQYNEGGLRWRCLWRVVEITPHFNTVETGRLEALCPVEFREVKPLSVEADAIAVEISADKAIVNGRIPQFAAFRGD